MRRRLAKGALPAVHPNAGIRAAYSRRLRALIAEMANSYEHWVRAQYRAKPPRMAMDATSASELQRLLRELGIRWEKRFEAAAPKLAEYFATSVRKRSEKRLQQILRDAGMTVKFKMTAELRDIMKAEIAENVGLIKSIPQQYHTQVEGLVMRSVSAGRDLSYLTKELKQRYGVTDRRARFIALDQNNKATAAIQRERQTALGIAEGIWMHSHAGKVLRRTHLANDRNRFSIAEGWHDPDPKVNRRIWPGELPNCRCTWRPIVAGFS
jgi:uncharacterized protein with gpF-like domain